MARTPHNKLAAYPAISRDATRFIWRSGEMEVPRHTAIMRARTLFFRFYLWCAVSFVCGFVLVSWRARSRL